MSQGGVPGAAYCEVNCAVVGLNLCARDPLDVKGKGVRCVGGIADKEAYTHRAINVISQRQESVAPSHSYCVGNVFCLRSGFFYPQASDVGKTQIFSPTIVTVSSVAQRKENVRLIGGSDGKCICVSLCFL
jgi:hypothetical protein